MMSKQREEAVWQRVLASSGTAPERPAAEMPRQTEGLTAAHVMIMLQGELQDACTYQTLAARTKQDVRRCLLQLAKEERCHARKLEAVYYLMTGVRPCPDRVKAPCVACVNEELRKRYTEETEGAAHYASMAEQAGTFGCLMRRLSMEEERHGRMILALLQKCL